MAINVEMHIARMIRKPPQEQGCGDRPGKTKARRIVQIGNARLDHTFIGVVKRQAPDWIGARARAVLSGRGYVTPQDVKSIGLDVLLCDGPVGGAPRPWVACPDGVESELDRLVTAVDQSPGASVALAQLLRVGEPLSAAGDAAAAEAGRA